MKITETSLPGVLLLEPRVIGDARGFFVESFREEWLAQAGIQHGFVQDNQSRSRKGVLRGLHYQTQQSQGKLVRVARGAVYDVAVDVRKNSPNFGRAMGMVLDDISGRQLYIPPGFAHGFCVLTDEVDFVYKCSAYYHPASDTGVLWNDPDLAIQWPEIGMPYLLSDKDQQLPRLRDQSRLPKPE